MKTLIALLVLFLATVSLSLAGAAKKTYSGSYKGQPCIVKVTWYNWEGLGPIAGMIYLSPGAVVTFSGSNSQPGVIELTAAGESFRLVRKGADVVDRFPILLFGSAGTDANPEPDATISRKCRRQEWWTKPTPVHGVASSSLRKCDGRRAMNLKSSDGV